MEKTFRKMTGLFSLLLVSMMLVSAGVYPIPFTNNNQANVAVVYGANAASTDSTAADSLVNSLANGIVTEEELERIFSDGIVEDEVKLGSSLDVEIRDIFTDNKIPSLFDGRISWDDGDDTDNYNVHEEIIIGALELKTTLDNEDFEGVVITNDRGLEYRLVFEEDIFIDGDRELGGNADALELTILGEEYLIEEVDDRSITVTKAKKVFLSEGDTTTIDGKTLTVDSIYDESIFINGALIKEGEKKTVNGIEVKVDEIYYSAKDSGVSKVEIYAGGDISEEYSDGDAFIGQDEDDPEWVWSISNPGKKEDGWIGVRYELSQTDEEDDVVYEEGKYIFPNGFATVSFDSLTDVEYYNYDVYFDEVDLYNKDSSGHNGAHTDDSQVVVIKGENDDSFMLDDNIETDTLYLLRSESDMKVYYMDLDEDFSTGKPVFYKDVNMEILAADAPESVAVAAAQGELDAAELALTTAQGVLTDANSYVTTSEGILDTAELAVTTAQGVLTDANADVTTAEGVITEVKAAVEIAEGVLTEAVAAYRAASNALNTDRTDENLNAYKEARLALVAAQTSLAEAKATEEANVAAAQGELDAANAYVTIAQGELYTANADAIAAQGELYTANADVTSAQGELYTANTYVTSAEDALIVAQEAAEAAQSFDDVIATLIADDTELEVKIIGTENIALFIGDIEISLGEDNNGFLHLGVAEENAESTDVIVSGTSIGTKDNDVMDHYGTIIESPESNADDDKVVFRVPSEQVYAQISVLGSEEEAVVTNVTVAKPTPAELGISKITDGNVASASGKNVIVIGGSCINTVAASLLGGKACGVEFTAKTGVSSGQALIQTFDRGDGSLATVVAGYDAADTARGVAFLLSNGVNIAAGEKVII